MALGIANNNFIKYLGLNKTIINIFSTTADVAIIARNCPKPVDIERDTAVSVKPNDNLDSGKLIIYKFIAVMQYIKEKGRDRRKPGEKIGDKEKD